MISDANGPMASTSIFISSIIHIPGLSDVNSPAEPVSSSVALRILTRNHKRICPFSPRPPSPDDNTTQCKPADALIDFHCFPNLCPELRLRIWTLIIPPPRFVPLTNSRLPPSSSHNHDRSGCTSTAPIPAILHVNRESRAFAMLDKGYTLSLNLIHRPPKIWFNYSTDVLYFSKPSKRRRSTEGDILEAFQNFHDVSHLVDPRELNKVRRLAVNVALFKTAWQGNRRGSEEDSLLLQFWHNIEAKFRRVEDITFVFPDNSLDDRSTTQRSCVFLPVEWLREEELLMKIEDFRRRVKQAFLIVGEVERSNTSSEKWTIPEWKIVVIEGNMAVL
jgi:hypothetical protein